MLNIGLLEDCHHGSVKTELLDFNTQLILDACTFEVSVLLLPAVHGTAALFYCPTMVYVYCQTAAYIIFCYTVVHVHLIQLLRSCFSQTKVYVCYTVECHISYLSLIHI